MEVILKEDVAKLGHRGEVVKVAEGYGRNYLLPRKLAIEATQGNKAVIDQMKQSAVRRSAVEKSDAEALAKQLEAVSLTFERKAGEKDLFMWLCEECDNQLYKVSVEVGDYRQDPVSQVHQKFYSDESLRTCKNCGTVIPAPPR